MKPSQWLPSQSKSQSSHHSLTNLMIRPLHSSDPISYSSLLIYSVSGSQISCCTHQACSLLRAIAFVDPPDWISFPPHVPMTHCLSSLWPLLKYHYLMKPSLSTQSKIASAVTLSPSPSGLFSITLITTCHILLLFAYCLAAPARISAPWNRGLCFGGFCFFVYLATPRSWCDPSSLARNWTQALGGESTES